MDVEFEVLGHELDAAKAEAAVLREWIEANHPESGVLAIPDIGREFLDRLRLAEASSNDSLVTGLFELRDSLKICLGFFTVTASNKNTFLKLKAVLNRWGDVHLRVLSKGELYATRRTEQKENDSEPGQVSDGGRSGATSKPRGRKRSGQGSKAR